MRGEPRARPAPARTSIAMANARPRRARAPHTVPTPERQHAQRRRTDRSRRAPPAIRRATARGEQREREGGESAGAPARREAARRGDDATAKAMRKERGSAACARSLASGAGPCSASASHGRDPSAAAATRRCGSCAGGDRQHALDRAAAPGARRLPAARRGRRAHSQPGPRCRAAMAKSAASSGNQPRSASNPNRGDQHAQAAARPARRCGCANPRPDGARGVPARTGAPSHGGTARTGAQGMRVHGGRRAPAAISASASQAISTTSTAPPAARVRAPGRRAARAPARTGTRRSGARAGASSMRMRGIELPEPAADQGALELPERGGLAVVRCGHAGNDCSRATRAPCVDRPDLRPAVARPCGDDERVVPVLYSPSTSAISGATSSRPRSSAWCAMPCITDGALAAHDLILPPHPPRAPTCCWCTRRSTWTTSSTCAGRRARAMSELPLSRRDRARLRAGRGRHHARGAPRRSTRGVAASTSAAASITRSPISPRGFCYINDLAVAIRVLQRDGRSRARPRSWTATCTRATAPRTCSATTPRCSRSRSTRSTCYPVKERERPRHRSRRTAPATRSSTGGWPRRCSTRCGSTGPSWCSTRPGADPYEDDQLGGARAHASTGLEARDRRCSRAAPSAASRWW